MTLARPPALRARVTLVPLIDVLFILLVFFMITSTYLDLDMIPMSRSEPAAAGQAGAISAARPMLLRIDADNRVMFRNRVLEVEALGGLLSSGDRTEIMILPSPRAEVQSLAALLDALARAGISQSRIVRLEARE